MVRKYAMPSDDRNVCAYYLWPGVWVGDDFPVSEAGTVDLSMVQREVFQTTLACGMRARVLAEGLFIFDFSTYAPMPSLPVKRETFAALTLRRIEAMNAHLACLYSAMHSADLEVLTKMVVSTETIINLNGFDDDSAVRPGPNPMIQRLVQTGDESTYTEQQSPKELDWRLNLRRCVTMPALHESFVLLDGIITCPSAPRVATLVDLYLRSVRALEEHNYGLSLALSWTIAETALNAQWEKYLDARKDATIEGHDTKVINSDRKAKLMGRDFTASTVSEILSLAGVLPFSLYKDLSAVRSERNAWLHSLKSVSIEAAKQSCAVAEEMVSLTYDISLNVPMTLVFYG